MIERISKNEAKLDNIILVVNNLNKSLDDYKKIQKDLKIINKYYGSRNWFKDKEAFERNKIPHIKAGILSEDSVWDLNDDIKELINEMNKIVNNYKKG